MSDDKKKSTLRELLEEGPIDPRIMSKLDLLEELQAAVARRDTKAILALGQKLRDNAKEIQAADLARRAAMDAVVEKATVAGDADEWTARLLQAFEYCGKTRVIAFDEAADKDSGNAATEYLLKIAHLLDEIPPGRRSALIPFLDSSNVGVKVAAAIHLKQVMPDRVVPILKEIRKNDPGSSGWSALWALPPDEDIDPAPSSPTGGANKP